MRGNTLDSFMLPVLIAFFAILQMRRPVRQYRLWLVGWVSLLLSHIFVPLAGHSDLSITMDCLRHGFSLLGVSFFAISFGSPTTPLRRLLLYAGLMTTIPSGIMVMAELGASPWILLVGILLNQAAAVLIGVQIGRINRRAFPWAMAICALTLVLMLRSLWLGHPLEIAGEDQFTQAFLTCALLQIFSPPRKNMGIWICIAGFLSWTASFFVLGGAPDTVAAPPLILSLWGLPRFLVGFGMCLTVLESDTDELQKLGEEYRLLYETNPHPMWIFDLKTEKILSVNDAAIAAYGYSRDEFRRMTMSELQPPEERTQRKLLDGDDTYLKDHGYCRHRRKDDSIFAVDVHGKDVVFRGRTARFITATDVSELERTNHDLVFRAQHNPLTGLPTQMLLEDRAQQAIARSARDGYKVAMIAVSVDRMAQINDTYGHRVGDEYLKAVVRRLMTRIRDADTLAHINGTEFVALIGGLTSTRGAQAAGNSLLASLATPLTLSDNQIAATVSAGIALYPDDGITLDAIRKRSEMALQSAKRMGGNVAMLVNEDLEAESHSATDIEAALRLALSGSGFEVYYQPIYDAYGNFARVEAVVRGRDEMLRQCGPAAFIPVAEESGLILQLGEWVLNEACRQLAVWRAQGLPSFDLAVNVSARQFAQADFSDTVLEILQRHRISPRLLHLELTETTLMRDFSTMVEGMKRLARAGVRFSIDDFGTGYSSLARLSELPISTLKIDRSFVLKLGQGSAPVGIVRAIANMARHLELEVVAEGVEDNQQIAILREAKCDLFQGFLLSKPLPASALPLHLQSEAEFKFARNAILYQRMPSSAAVTTIH